MSLKRVIHLGAYGTGTNWVAATLRKSGVDIYEQAGVDPDSGRPVRHFFKHYIIESDTLSILGPPEDALFVCLVKSPLFWIGSLRRMVAANLVPAPEMRALRGAGMPEFIRAPGTMVAARREIEGRAFVNYDNLPDLWNRYAAGYLAHLPADRVLLLPYESTLRDPPAAFGSILDRLDIPRSRLVVHTERRMGTGHDLLEAWAYYGDDRNRLAPFGDDDIAFVNERIDDESLTALGYEPDGSIRATGPKAGDKPESKRIFVQIASYRDPELPRTIESCLQNARHPHRLTFGICQQYDETTAADLAPYENDARFRVDKVDYRESQGCCWARNRTNRLYRGEEYTLQVDAHTRFAQSWDEALVVMIEAIDDDKPLLSTYPPGYAVINGETVLSDMDSVQRLRLKKLNPDLTTHQEGEEVAPTDKPGESRFIAAGFIFTLGRFCVDVEYDPEIYFSGEEINLAARAYTHGYNFYYPTKNLLWHRYDHGNPLHWSDHPDKHGKKHQTALERLDTLLLGDHTRLGKYGLGNERALLEYEAYAGINFAEAAERRTQGADTVPFRRTIVLNTSEIEKRGDYERWVFCLLNDDDSELYRYDIVDPGFLNHEKTTIRIEMQLPAEPARYMLWPKHREWGRKLVYPLPEQEPGEQARREPQPTIFVALAAYCEPELVLTIESCLSHAVFPDRLRFGICLQYDDEGPPEIRKDCLARFEHDPRFRIVKYPYRDSEGGCWARNIVQSMYREEALTLQVDSHTRFLRGWDVALAKMMEELPSPKPLITGFPPLYYIEEDGRERLTDVDDLSRVPTTRVKSWSEEGWIDHPTEYIAENSSFPRRTRVLSGAFVFTLGKWNHEVNQDPGHLYTGEELALTLRSFTHGYDLFNPSHIVVWHRCHPRPNRKYINDFETETVRARHKQAMKRLQALLSGDPDNELGVFGLGRARTLEQYRLFSGLDCRNRTIHPDAVKGTPPDPVTIPGSQKDLESSEQDSRLLDVTIHLEGADPVLVRCERNAPVLAELYAAVEANARRSGSDRRDRMIRLNFGREHHELYFLESRLIYVETGEPH